MTRGAKALVVGAVAALTGGAVYVLTAMVTPGASDTLMQTCAPCANRFMGPGPLSIGAGAAAGYVTSQSIGTGTDGAAPADGSTGGPDTGEMTGGDGGAPEDDDFWEDWTSCEG